MKLKTIIAAAAALLFTLPVNADSGNADVQDILRFDIEARVDWQNLWHDGDTDDSNSGFKARYLVIRADGMIVPGLTYSWRQRLNKQHSDQSFFDATDWVYLNWRTGKWNFQVGKEVVAIGGWEYDRAPIDLYGCSLFWNNVPCYDLGVSAGYHFPSGDVVTAQVVQSPFFTSSCRNMYAYNILWSGTHKWFSAIYSANLIEYEKGKYINYLSLGNKFSFGKFAVELDFMNRASSGQTFLFKDCTVVGELNYQPTDRWKVHAKMTYDVNHSGTLKDFTVSDGTELTMAGAGVEYYPLRKGRHTLRLHANCYYSWGHNANSADMMQDKSLFLSAGITWDMNLLNIGRK